MAADAVNGTIDSTFEGSTPVCAHHIGEFSESLLVCGCFESRAVYTCRSDRVRASMGFSVASVVRQYGL